MTAMDAAKYIYEGYIGHFYLCATFRKAQDRDDEMREGDHSSSLMRRPLKTRGTQVRRSPVFARHTPTTTKIC
ncbi:hypothetical protein [Rhodospirillum sp. A1_3_36]|uniref:hypothetical protein n=1 Tax=Rhodospirillum sp. A1_3_36 TaxID=3391666 RepID=UPI0039A6FA70